MPNENNNPRTQKAFSVEQIRRNIKKLKVVYSQEHAINTNDHPINQDRKFKVKGSVSFVPSVAGLIIAGEVIKDIANE